MRRSPLWILIALAAGAASGIGLALLRRSEGRRDASVDLWAEADAIAARSTPAVPVMGETESRARRLAQTKADEVAASRRGGSPEDRESDARPSVGLDVARLQSMRNSLEPVVQYLTYIQSRRGDDSSLLFVRYDDIDAMAELDGEPSQELLDRLDQLGVVVSSN